MRYGGFTIVLLLSVTSLVRAQQFDIHSFLGSVHEDPLVRNAYDQTDYLRSADMRTPNINEVEVRTRSDNTSLSIDDVRLRLTFTNFGEIRQGGRYNELLIENYDLEYQVRIHAALTHRYELLIDQINISSELDLIHRLKLNIEDQIKVEKGSILNSTGDVTDLAKLELDYTDLMVKESELNNKRVLLQSMFKSLYMFEGDVIINDDSLVAPGDIKNYIDNPDQAVHPEIALREQDIALSAQEIQLEKKEEFGDLGYMQAEYEIDPDRETTENLGYQLGFSLPITNPDKAQIERTRLKNLKQKQNLDYLTSENSRKTEILRIELLEQINQYNYMEDQLEKLVENNKSLAGSYLKLSTILTMKENELQLEKALQKQTAEIFITYLNWLDLSGYVSKLPFQNYLYKSLPELGN